MKRKGLRLDGDQTKCAKLDKSTVSSDVGKFLKTLVSSGCNIIELLSNIEEYIDLLPSVEDFYREFCTQSNNSEELLQWISPNYINQDGSHETHLILKFFVGLLNSSIIKTHERFCFRLARSLSTMYIEVILKQCHVKDHVLQERGVVAFQLLTAILRIGEKSLLQDMFSCLNVQHPGFKSLGTGIHSSKSSESVNDLSKVRACFVEFVTTFLLVADDELVNRLAQRKDMFSIILPGLLWDGVDLIRSHVSALERRLLKNPCMSKTAKLKFFDFNVLKHIVNLLGWSRNISFNTGAKLDYLLWEQIERGVAMGLFEQDQLEVQEAVFSLMRTLCLDKLHGIGFLNSCGGIDAISRNRNPVIHHILKLLVHVAVQLPQTKPFILDALARYPIQAKFLMDTFQPQLGSRSLDSRWFQLIRFVHGLLNSETYAKNLVLLCKQLVKESEQAIVQFLGSCCGLNLFIVLKKISTIAESLKIFSALLSVLQAVAQCVARVLDFLKAEGQTGLAVAFRKFALKAMPPLSFVINCWKRAKQFVSEMKECNYKTLESFSTYLHFYHCVDGYQLHTGMLLKTVTSLLSESIHLEVPSSVVVSLSSLMVSIQKELGEDIGCIMLEQISGTKKSLLFHLIERSFQYSEARQFIINLVVKLERFSGVILKEVLEIFFRAGHNNSLFMEIFLKRIISPDNDCANIARYASMDATKAFDDFYEYALSLPSNIMDFVTPAQLPNVIRDTLPTIPSICKFASNIAQDNGYFSVLRLATDLVDEEKNANFVKIIMSIVWELYVYTGSQDIITWFAEQTSSKAAESLLKLNESINEHLQFVYQLPTRKSHARDAVAQYVADAAALNPELLSIKISIGAIFYGFILEKVNPKVGVHFISSWLKHLKTDTERNAVVVFSLSHPFMHQVMTDSGDKDYHRYYVLEFLPQIVTNRSAFSPSTFSIYTDWITNNAVLLLCELVNLRLEKARLILASWAALETPNQFAKTVLLLFTQNFSNASKECDLMRAMMGIIVAKFTNDEVCGPINSCLVQDIAQHLEGNNDENLVLALQKIDVIFEENNIISTNASWTRAFQTLVEKLPTCAAPGLCIPTLTKMLLINSTCQALCNSIIISGKFIVTVTSLPIVTTLLHFMKEDSLKHLVSLAAAAVSDLFVSAVKNIVPILSNWPVVELCFEHGFVKGLLASHLEDFWEIFKNADLLRIKDHLATLCNANMRSDATSSILLSSCHELLLSLSSNLAKPASEAEGSDWEMSLIRLIVKQVIGLNSEKEAISVTSYILAHRFDQEKGVKVLISLIDHFGSLPGHSPRRAVALVVSSEMFQGISELNRANLKTQYLLMLRSLCERNLSSLSDVLPDSLLPVLLSSYSATIGDAELLRVIKYCEMGGVDFSKYAPITWGRVGLENYTSRNESPALWNRPTPDDVLYAIDSDLLLKSAYQFTMSIPLQGGEPDLDGVKPTTMSPTTENIYDPRFLLPLLAQILEPGTVVSCDKFADRYCVVYAISALTSYHADVRQLAQLILWRYKVQLKSSAAFPQKPLISYFLSVLRNSLSSHPKRVTFLPATFLLRQANLIMSHDNPEAASGIVFDLTHKYLMAKPIMNLEVVPDFSRFFNSTAPVAFRLPRAWLLEAILAGLRDDADYHLLNQGYCIAVLLYHFSSCLADSNERRLICSILLRLADIRSAAVTFIQRGTLWVWMVGACRRVHVDGQCCVAFINILEKAWDRMFSSSGCKILVDDKLCLNNVNQMLLALFRIFLAWPAQIIGLSLVKNYLALVKKVYDYGKICDGEDRKVLPCPPDVLNKILNFCSVFSDNANKDIELETLCISCLSECISDNDSLPKDSTSPAEKLRQMFKSPTVFDENLCLSK